MAKGGIRIMNRNKSMERLSIIFSKSDMERIHTAVAINGEEIIVADVHGMTGTSAKHFIKNIIALIKDEFLFTVVHGFNNGTVIRDMLRNDFQDNRVSSIRADDYNEGRTILSVNAMY